MLKNFFAQIFRNAFHYIFTVSLKLLNHLLEAGRMFVENCETRRTDYGILRGALSICKRYHKKFR